MSRHSVSLTVALALALAFGGGNARADVVLSSDFAFAQSAMADTTFAAMVSSLTQAGFPIDFGATLHYDGILSTSLDSAGDLVGTYSGHLGGTYLGDPVSFNFAGNLLPVTPVDPDFVGTGEGEEPGSKDKVKISVDVKVDDANGTATVKGKYKGKDIEGKDFKKRHDATKKQDVYEGHVEVNGEPASLDISVDDNADPKTGKKKLHSQLDTMHTAYHNEGEVGLLDVNPTGSTYAVSFDIGIGPLTAVPEPGVLTLVATSGLMGLGSWWFKGRRAGV